MKIQSKSNSVFNVCNYPICIDGQSFDFTQIGDNKYQISYLKSDTILKRERELFQITLD